MHAGFLFYISKLSSYIITYQIKICIVTSLLLTCWLLHTASIFYHLQGQVDSLLKKKENTDQYLSSINLKEMEHKQKEDMQWIEEASALLKNYRIPLFHNQKAISSEEFQHQLEKDISFLQEKAKLNVVTLPSPCFFLLEFSHDKKNYLTQEDIILANKEETVLFWLADHLCNIKDLNLIKFSFVNKTKKLGFIAGEELGFVILEFITYESSVKNFINNVINSPYYFIIEKISLENNNYINKQSASLSKKNPEEINCNEDTLRIFIKVRLFDFNL